MRYSNASLRSNSGPVYRMGENGVFKRFCYKQYCRIADFPLAQNPTAGDNCNLLEGFCYCVQVNFQTQTPATQTKTWTPTTSSSTSTQAPISTPTPTQAGMVGNCNKFHLVVSGDNCYDIAAKYGVKLNDFYTWNPATGTSCSGLWLDYYVCVGVTTGGTPPTPTPTTLIPSTTTPPPGGVATPTPIQNGMVKNCDTFHLVVAGDNCYDIAAKSKIALNDFYTWNPDVGNTCANLWAGYYVCIGIL